jgi:peptidyl-prolyl cis-trans isomerase SurA
MKHDMRILWTMLLVLPTSCGCAKRAAAPYPPAHASASPCDANQIRMSEILIKAWQPRDPAQEAGAQQSAEKVREDIRGGGVFADLARANSQGPTAAQGGDMGCISHGQLAQSLENLVFHLKIGAVSDVLRTEQGFVILQVTDHNDGAN